MGVKMAVRRLATHTKAAWASRVHANLFPTAHSSDSPFAPDSAFGSTSPTRAAQGVSGAVIIVDGSMLDRPLVLWANAGTWLVRPTAPLSSV
jgi:hypothetical protein